MKKWKIKGKCKERRRYVHVYIWIVAVSEKEKYVNGVEEIFNSVIQENDLEPKDMFLDWKELKCPEQWVKIDPYKCAS